MPSRLGAHTTQIGTPGHNVVPVLNEALLAWSGAKLKTIHYVMKGTNSLTEHYSALKADVEIPDDPSTGVHDCDYCADIENLTVCCTGLNVRLITQLQGADKVIVCGQALSHCVNFTVRDLAESWPLDKYALFD
jgi:nicotinamidase-related amidase